MFLSAIVGSKLETHRLCNSPPKKSMSICAQLHTYIYIYIQCVFTNPGMPRLESVDLVQTATAVKAQQRCL